MSLQQLDAALTDIATAVVGVLGNGTEWRSLRYAARWTPEGDVGADDFWVVDDSGREKKVMPELAPALHVSNVAKHHWRLTQDLGQARWYQMTVTVERSGKFSADFEYKDDYREGDIMQRG